jgi:hypothetical protein
LWGSLRGFEILVSLVLTRLGKSGIVEFMNKFLLFLSLLVVTILACVAPVDLNQPVISSSSTPTQTLFAPTQTPTFTPTVRPQPTPTITPTSSIRLVPCGDGDICTIPDNDVDLLGRLCAVEVRGFGSMQDTACVSVISTVYARMAQGYLSDGTVLGTIIWGCKPDSQTCEFPAHVWFGCKGILPEACAWSYPHDIAHFTDVAQAYIDDPKGLKDLVGGCMGYTYYGSLPESIAKSECRITSESGKQIEGFYN